MELLKTVEQMIKCDDVKDFAIDLCNCTPEQLQAICSTDSFIKPLSDDDNDYILAVKITHALFWDNPYKNTIVVLPTQKRRRAFRNVLDDLLDTLPDWLTSSIKKETQSEIRSESHTLSFLLQDIRNFRGRTFNNLVLVAGLEYNEDFFAQLGCCCSRGTKVFSIGNSFAKQYFPQSVIIVARYLVGKLKIPR